MISGHAPAVDPAVRATLFRAGEFKSHSGLDLLAKIECDALTRADYLGIVKLMEEARIIPQFGGLIAIPEGGNRLATALSGYLTTGPRLFVDDVLTTGKSMREAMTQPDDIGLVVFARGPLPPRVTALFAMPAALSKGTEGE